MKHVGPILVISLILVISVPGLEVLSPVSGEYFTPTSQVYTKLFEEVTAEVYFMTDPDNDDIEDIDGKILLVKGPMFNGENLDKKTSINPSAVLFTDGDDYPGNEATVRYMGYTDKGIPFAFIHTDDYSEIYKLSKNGTVPVRATLSVTDSLWAYKSLWVVQTILGAVSLLVVFISMRKLVYHIQENKGITVTLAIMVSEIIANFARSHICKESDIPHYYQLAIYFIIGAADLFILD
eukprot:TRINITY_DN8574_c0_g1_i2.p1 TRINITY_DN8574_c0_g1~~TRINITY_DN8574_c0_g1_i2.p1  ORF type:complete len:237 (-),score=36.79 TRINITY_DN8574_c0_g1_i2:612-1322(-)